MASVVRERRASFVRAAGVAIAVAGFAIAAAAGGEIVRGATGGTTGGVAAGVRPGPGTPLPQIQATVQEIAKAPWVSFLQIGLDKYEVAAGTPIKVSLMIATQKWGAAQEVRFNLTVAGPPTVPTPKSAPAFTRRYEPDTMTGGDSGMASIDTAGLLPETYTVTLTATDAAGRSIKAVDSFKVTEGGGGSGGGGAAADNRSGGKSAAGDAAAAKPVKEPAKAKAKFIYSGDEGLYSMAINVDEDADGNAIITSGLVRIGLDEFMIVGGMGGILAVGGAPGGAHFQVPKCSLLGEQADLEGNFVDPVNPQVIKVPKAGVKEVSIKITGFYSKTRKPVTDPRGNPYVIFKLKLLGT
jgi:hypothetical protein